jgi:NTE family protein
VVTRAVVLGGGGNTGFAWQWGVLTGLHDAGIALGEADVVIGTSGGGMAAAHLRGGEPPRQLLARIGKRATDGDHGANEETRARFTDELRRLFATAQDAKEILAGLGALALKSSTPTEDSSKQLVAAYLTAHDWPQRRLLIPAVDVISGELEVFSQDSGVPLVDALAASNSIPGVWPPITINGRRFMDGALRSPTNADLAAGHDRVLVIAPQPDTRGMPGASLAEALAPVQQRGQAVAITPDDPTRKEIVGSMLDWSRLIELSQIGLADAATAADQVRELWGTPRPSRG